MEPTATAPDAATVRDPIAGRGGTDPGAVRRLWTWAVTGRAYPPDPADARTIHVLGVDLPARATLAILFVTLVVMLDHAGRFMPWFSDGIGSAPELARAQAISRGVVLGVGTLALILLVFRDSPGRYGLRLGDVRAGMAIALAGCVTMTPLVLLAASWSDFRGYYLPLAATSTPNIALTTALEVIPAELFFRGLLMFALLRVIGPLAILLATLPFAFAHLGKPEVETLSTLFGGFAYGWLDWRTGSVLWSGIAHTYILSLAIVLSGALGPA